MDRNRWTATGALAGAAYLAAERLCPLPDFFAGLLLGLGAVCLVRGLLPEAALAAVRRWKRHGE